MSLGLGTVAKIATTALPFLMPHGASHINVGAINRKYMGMQPTGYLTPADYAEADRGLSRGMDVLGGRMRSAKARAITTAAQRGYLSSPASEYLGRSVDQQEADAALGLQNRREDWLSGVRRGREGFEGSKIMTAWQNELGGALHNQAADQAERAGFWNSMIGMAGPAMDWFSQGSDSGLPTDDLKEAANFDPIEGIQPHQGGSGGSGSWYDPYLNM